MTRSLMHLLEIIEELKAREVELKSYGKHRHIDLTGRGFLPLWVLFLRWSARLRRNGLLPDEKRLKPGQTGGVLASRPNRRVAQKNRQISLTSYAVRWLVFFLSYN